MGLGLACSAVGCLVFVDLERSVSLVYSVEDTGCYDRRYMCYIVAGLAGLLDLVGLVGLGRVGLLGYLIGFCPNRLLQSSNLRLTSRPYTLRQVSHSTRITIIAR